MAPKDRFTPSTRQITRLLRPSRLAPHGTTPRGYRRSRRKADFYDLDTFTHFHWKRDERLQKYLDKGYAPYVKVSNRVVWERGKPSDRHRVARISLYANNLEGRIDFVGIALRHVMRSELAASNQIFLVTLTPADFTVDLMSAATFNFFPLQQLARQALHGIPFIGMVEAALYPGKDRKIFGSLGDRVSWHVHLLVWGADRKAIVAALRGLKAKRKNMLGRSPVHILDVQPSQLEAKLVYILKAPQKEYFINPIVKPFRRRNGDIVQGDAHQKRPLRSGNRARMCSVLENRLLDKMMFGNAAGTLLVNAIRDEALQPFRRWQMRQPKHPTAENV